MTNQSREKLFAKFLSSGFSENNQNQAWMFPFYQVNYQSVMQTDKDIKILDLGCGMGHFLGWLKNLGYKNYLGVDLSQEAVNYCQKNVTDQVLKIESIKEFLADNRETYDLIVLNDVIEHLNKSEIVSDLEIIRQALKKDGQVIIKTGNASAITGLHMRFVDFTHEVGFTEHSLAQVLKVAGFKQSKIYPFVLPVNSIFRVIRLLLQKLLHAVWKLIYFAEYSMVPENVHDVMFAVAKK